MTVGTPAARGQPPSGGQTRMTNKTDNWRSRGYLPHFDDQRSTQFITFRLADSLPSGLIEKAKWKLDNGVIDEIEYHRRLDRWMDRGRGECYLKQHRVAKMVAENLLHFSATRYDLRAWVIMPNHVHLLLTPVSGTTLAQIMHSMKSYTAHRANEILKRQGHFWSKEYFDRYIRNHEHLCRTVDYIRYNPVKAGLCKWPEEWPFGSAGMDR